MSITACPLCKNRMRDDIENGEKFLKCGCCGTKLFLGGDQCQKNSESSTKKTLQQIPNITA